MTEANPALPSHVEDTIHSISELHSTHREAATGLQLASDQLTRFFSQPRFIGILTLGLAAWLAAGIGLPLLGRAGFDPWPFQGLQSVTSVIALYMTVFILMTQRREDELAELRGQLTLELSIMSEQKVAKVIELMEELRRDLPSVRDRGDAEADALATPADHGAVAAALKEIQLEAKSLGSSDVDDGSA